MSTPSGPVAVRFPLGAGTVVDPFAIAGSGSIVFVAGGRTLVGLGVAATIPLPHGLDDPDELAAAVRQLASIPCDDRRGPSATSTENGVLAFGALPFDRSAPAALVVPEAVVGVEPSGERWATIVSPEAAGPGGQTDMLHVDPETLEARLSRLHDNAVRRDDAAREDDASHAVGAAGSPSGPELVLRSTDDSFQAMVEEALKAIDRGELSKVVLARQLEVTGEHPFDIGGLLRRWHQLEPGCTVFSVPGDGEHFVGASPELLVERAGLQVHSRPLAGTTDAGANPDVVSGDLLPPELLESEKDATEHRLVVDAIAQRLGPLCAALDVPERPDLVRLHDMVHLGTSVTGRLTEADGERAPSALDLVSALHPTPAVGGVPTSLARTLIATLEPGPRGRYAGPVGYVDAGGDGRWVLGIRAASIHGRSARLTAGAGIVEGSDPLVELAETTLKLNSALDALVPGLRLPMPAARYRQRVVS